MKVLAAVFTFLMTAVFAAAFFVVVALPRLVENKLLAALADTGVGDAELTVERVGWRQASIVDLRIGDGLTIAVITAGYTPGEIVDGRLRELIVEGLILRGAVSGDGVAFAALDPWLGDSVDAEAPALPLDTIVLQNSRVELTTPLGDVTVTAEGTVHVIEGRELDGLLDITILAAPASLIGRLSFAVSKAKGYDAQLEITETFLGSAPPLAGEIAATLEAGRLAVDGALYTPDGALALTAAITIADIAARGSRFTLDADLWVTDPPLLNQLSLSEGRVAVTLSGVIPVTAEPSGLTLAGSLDLDLDGVSLPGVGEGLSLSGTMTVETNRGVVTIASEQGLRLEASHLELPEPADTLRLDLKPMRAVLRPGRDGFAVDGAATGRLRLGGNGIITADFAGRLDVDADGTPRRFDLRRLTASASDLVFGGVVFDVDGLRLSLAGTPEAFTGNAQATLSTDSVTRAGVSLTRAVLRLTTALAYGRDGLTLTLGEGVSLDAAYLTVPGLAPLAFHVETAGESVITMAGDGRIRHDLRLALPATEIEVSSLAATVTLPALRLRGVFGADYRGTLEITGGALRLPGRDIALDGIDASLELDERKLRGDFTARSLRHPAVAPLAVTGSFDLAGGVLGFTGRLTGGGDALSVEVAGRHDLTAGSGGATVEMARLTLDPATLRLGDLAPGLGGFATDVLGTIAAVGRLGWGDGGLTSEATLLIEDLSLDAGDIRFERVNSVIAFDSLWPPSTPPAQQVAIGLIDAGLPLTDGIIDFQLRPDGVLNVENAVWRWAGGRLKTQGVRLDPNAERHGFTLEVDDLDLAEIAALADLADLSASGRLSGRVPVAVTAEGFAIVAGRLETAPGGGLLRYAPALAPAALRQGGEGATLALSVLENFRYETLRIDIDRDAGGDAEIAVHLRGSNADVYDGYPIEFNLNISGPIDRMLRRGLVGYRVPDAVTERLQGFGGQ